MISMYKQFCKNLKYYLQLNDSDDYRSLVGEELMILIDKDQFNGMKKNNNSQMNDINRLIHLLYRIDHKKCNKFVWELYAYGFDISLEKMKENPCEMKSPKDVDKIELIKLLLGTTYWH